MIASAEYAFKLFEIRKLAVAALQVAVIKRSGEAFKALPSSLIVLIPANGTIFMDIFTSHAERKALDAVDARELDEELDLAIKDGRIDNLRKFKLGDCGIHIAGRMDAFARAMSKHREARSSRKAAETGHYLQTLRQEMVFGVKSWQRRVEEERKDEERFEIRGEFLPPYSFNQRLSARVNYQWRRTIDDEWSYGSITFLHNVDLAPAYRWPPPKRKPTAAKKREEEQEQLSRTWEFLMRGALYSVRGYFRDGGEPSGIPETFQATVGDGGHLNNHSTDFWRKKA